MWTRVITLVLVCVLLLSAGPLIAQDDGWTCDDGPNDVLNAAQAAYDAGELERAYELAQQAEAVCGAGATMNTARYLQATQLRAKAGVEVIPMPTPSPGEKLVELNRLGSEAQRQGRYEEALAYYEQALTIAREVGDRASEGTTLSYIGLVYYRQGRHQQALDYYQQALAVAHEEGNQHDEAAALIRISTVLIDKGDYLDC